MPNNCNNKLTVKGENDEIKKFILENTINYMINFNVNVPINDNSREEAYKYWGSFITGGGQDCSEWKENKIEFYTAWAPPIQYFVTVSKKYPSLTFVLFYEEFCMDIYGVRAIKDGKLILIINDIFMYMSFAHKIKNPEDVIKRIEYNFSKDFEYDYDEIYDYDYVLGVYISHSLINYENEWEHYKITNEIRTMNENIRIDSHEINENLVCLLDDNKNCS